MTGDHPRPSPVAFTPHPEYPQAKAYWLGVQADELHRILGPRCPVCGYTAPEDMDLATDPEPWHCLCGARVYGPEAEKARRASTAMGPRLVARRMAAILEVVADRATLPDGNLRKAIDEALAAWKTAEESIDEEPIELVKPPAVKILGEIFPPPPPGIEWRRHLEIIVENHKNARAREEALRARVFDRLDGDPEDESALAVIDRTASNLAAIERRAEKAEADRDQLEARVFEVRNLMETHLVTLDTGDDPWWEWPKHAASKIATLRKQRDELAGGPNMPPPAERIATLKRYCDEKAAELDEEVDRRIHAEADRDIWKTRYRELETGYYWKMDAVRKAVDG